VKIKKVSETYNTYALEVSYGQLQVMLQALEQHPQPDAITDEARAEISWYLNNLPGPGEDKEDIEQAEQGMQPNGGQPGPQDKDPLAGKPADDLLPQAPDDGAGPGGPEGGPAGAPGEPGPEGEGEPMPAPRGGGDEGGSEADRRLPPPPED
jgi:hypothetical protein